MKVSVILCTYNRCELLARALDSVLACQSPDSTPWQLLVVDNNSSDSTRAIVEARAAIDPRVRYIFEPRQGKSNALNRGVREADGDILAFVDDDVQVDSNWLSELCAPLSDSRWAGAGGRIRAPKDFTAPPWMPLQGEFSLGGILAFFDLGDNPQELREAPFGTNMAFRKTLFEKYGPFRADLGPTPGTEIRGEDTEFGRRVMKAGELLWYQPNAIVYHPVPQNRLKKSYFLRFLYDQGRALVREWDDGRVWIFRTRHIKLLRLVFRSIPERMVDWLFSFEPGERFSSKGMVWMTFGQIAEICNYSGGKDAAPSVKKSAV